MRRRQLVVRNRMAFASWVFSAFWILFSLLALYMLIRDWQDLELSSRILIPVICVGGLSVLTPLCLSQCILEAVFDHSQCRVHLTRRWLFRKDTQSFPFNAVKGIAITESRDSDGDPYYHLDLTLSDNSTHTLREGHHRPNLESVEQRIRESLKESDPSTQPGN